MLCSSRTLVVIAMLVTIMLLAMLVTLLAPSMALLAIPVAMGCGILVMLAIICGFRRSSPWMSTVGTRIKRTGKPRSPSFDPGSITIAIEKAMQQQPGLFKNLSKTSQILEYVAKQLANVPLEDMPAEATRLVALKSK